MVPSASFQPRASGRVRGLCGVEQGTVRNSPRYFVSPTIKEQPLVVDCNYSHVGVGLYSIADVARFSGAHPESVRRWLSDKKGIIPRYFPKQEQLVTFQELIEVHFVALFRSEGVSFQVIRRAAEAAARRFGSDYPFTIRRFDTDGRTVFATLMRERPDELLVEDLQRGQYVFQSIVRPFFRKLEYLESDEHVVRYWPLAKSRRSKGRVVLDPARKFGKPIDAETGVPTGAIYEAVRAGGGQSPDAVARWLDIPCAAVEAAVDFERSLREVPVR